jgi:Fe-S-cluster-containing dehydrogenase component/DMSO reductase anchor subunit
MTATLTPVSPSTRFSSVGNGYALIDALLEEQQQTAVERFAEFHETATTAENTRQLRYRNLIPLTQPQPGEQYAFEVDLDACSGCKACVAACHNLNGLEESETWRNVGLLVGGNDRLPVMQHVTTACHHCIEPACLDGCPVLAYDKDPVTGIVRHLDDQCIGCQYCIFKCPYDVPVYSRAKGIVRKCDMCHSRLAVGEAPACVQACPNGAIRIRLVDRQEILDGSETNHFLPGAPDPTITLPTTIYKSKGALPRNVLPADYYSAKSQHAHLPLVWMLVLTQMSVGAFLVEQLLAGRAWTAAAALPAFDRASHLVFALLLGFLGLFAAVFHLGRPQYAYRAVLGLRTSWLSREILAFGVYASLAGGYVGLALLNRATGDASGSPARMLGVGAGIAGVAGVLCSVMIYVDTRRPFWSATPTTLKFLLTACVLGSPLALSIAVWTTWFSAPASVAGIIETLGRPICGILIAVVLAKLSVELAVLLHLRQRQNTPLKRAATLLVGELSRVTLLRVFFAVVGGVLLPCVLLAERALTAGGSFQPLFVGVVTVLMVMLLTVGELLERYTFFAVSIAPKMPGVQAA